MDKRTERYITLALQESLNSTYSRVRIGAVLVDGNYIVSKGANLSTSHPMQFRYNQRNQRDWHDGNKHNCHAEMNALIKSKRYDLTNCEIFVARFDRVGNLAMCRPCPACQGALADAGISRVIYTSPQGIVKEKL